VRHRKGLFKATEIKQTAAAAFVSHYRNTVDKK